MSTEYCEKWFLLKCEHIKKLETEKKRVVELLAEVLRQTCAYEEMMELKVSELQEKIEDLKKWNREKGIALAQCDHAHTDLEKQITEANKILNDPIPSDMALASDLQCLRFLEKRIAKATAILTVTNEESAKT